MTRPLTLTESADLLGRYRYVELALFHTLGARSISAENPVVVAYLAGAARAHGWRARLVEERLPVSVGLPGIEASTRSPGQAVEEVLGLLGAPAPDDELVGALLVALYPAMSNAYLERLSAAAPVSDAPVVRMLRRLVVDLEQVGDEGKLVGKNSHDEGLSREVTRLLGLEGGPFGPIVDPNAPSAEREALGQVRPS